jgi:hypothetical protein
VVAAVTLEEQYEAGLWIPVCYGNKYSVAKKGEPTLEKDRQFRFRTLEDAMREAQSRNTPNPALRAH